MLKTAEQQVNSQAPVLLSKLVLADALQRLILQILFHLDIHSTMASAFSFVGGLAFLAFFLPAE
jgi:hypothetical protein